MGSLFPCGYQRLADERLARLPYQFIVQGNVVHAHNPKTLSASRRKDTNFS
jgi:hypothetical protein